MVKGKDSFVAEFSNISKTSDVIVLANNIDLIRLQVVLSERDSEKLEFCAKETGLSKGEIVRQGVDRVYQYLLANETDAKKEQ